MTRRVGEIGAGRLSAHRAKQAARQKAYRLRDPIKYALIARAHRRKLKIEAVGHYGGRCACCGESRIEFMAIDHIGGNGNADRIARCGAVRGGTDFYRKLRQAGWPDGYRVLCHNCNQAIGFYGKCPHEAVL